MTLEELDTLRFNTPLYSNIDGTLWFYDCQPSENTVKIFKELVDTTPPEQDWGNRTIYGNRWSSNRDPWKRNGSLSITPSMLLEDFDIIYSVVVEDVTFVKKIKYLMKPYSLVKSNPHMIKGLPF